MRVNTISMPELIKTGKKWYSKEILVELSSVMWH